MSWNSFLFVKCISAFNYMWLIYNNTHNKCQNMYHYLKDYYYGYHDIWLFIPGHNFPLSLTNLNNIINVQWIYDNYDNTLMFITNDEHTDCKLSWLSAKIKLDAKEYDIDDFIEKFSIHTSNITPSLYYIFLCWCAYTKYWFKMDSNIEFHIIDENGEERILTLKDSIVIKNNKAYGENTQSNDEQKKNE